MIDFPASPTNGQIFNSITGGIYQWDGVAWNLTPMSNQLAFPATQIPSSDPNTLDDYEEGTWTVVVTPTSGAFGNLTASGGYTKIGRLVIFGITINCIAVGTAVGCNTNLPFPIVGNISCYGRETQSTGKALAGQLNTSTTLAILTYDNASPVGNNYTLNIWGSYFTTT